MEHPRAQPQTPSAEEPIREGEGRFPWWIWIVFFGWLIYAFLIAPFEVTHP